MNGSPPSPDGTIKLSSSAYFELLAATEKYITLLNETSPGYFSFSDMKVIDDIVFSDGIVIDNEPAGVRVTKSSVVFIGIQAEINISDIQSNKSNGRTVLLTANNKTWTIVCLSSKTAECLSKAISVRRTSEDEIISVTPMASKPHQRVPMLPQRTMSPLPPKVSEMLPIQHSSPASPHHTLSLTQNVLSPHKVEGVVLSLSNLSLTQSIKISVTSPSIGITTIPIANTSATITTEGDIRLTESILPSSVIPVCGFDSSASRVSNLNINLQCDGNPFEQVAVSLQNTAPNLVTITLNGHTVKLLPGETGSLASVPANGVPFRIDFSFHSLDKDYQLGYLLPIASDSREPEGFSLSKLHLDFDFDSTAIAAYMSERLNTEIRLVRQMKSSEQGSEQLSQRCSEEQKLFVDLDFIETMISDVQESEGLILKRPQQFLSIHREAAQVIAEIPSTSISSGRLGHRWWVAAARALAEHKELLHSCLPEYNLPFGSYLTRVCTSGWWMTITCDTWIPCYISQPGGPAYSTIQSNELWVHLLEKTSAWLAGSYSSLRFGTIGRALALFTGAAYHRINLSTQQIDTDAFWDELQLWLEQDCIICVAGSDVEPNPSDDKIITNSESEMSLSSATVLSAVSYNGFRLLRLRGDVKWNGPWGWSDDIWKQNISQNLYHNYDTTVVDSDRKNSTTWMPLESIFQNFSTLTVCHLRSGWGDIRVHGELFGKYPNFVTVIETFKTTRAVIQLQPASPGVRCPTLGIAVLKKDPNPMIAYEVVTLVPTTGTPLAGPDDPPVAVELTLQSGSEYIIIPSRVDLPTGSEVSQYVLGLGTEVSESGVAHFREVSKKQLGDMYYSTVCRQGKGQDAKPYANGDQSPTSVWWREDTTLPVGMVLENKSPNYLWKCQVATEEGTTRLSLPPNTKLHIFPDMSAEDVVFYDHIVSIYHTSSYHETDSDLRTLFDYVSRDVLAKMSRPVQLNYSSAIHTLGAVNL